MLEYWTGLLERHPGAGYFGAVPPVISGIVSWAQIDRLLGTLGLAVGLAVGVLTALLQWENLKRKRRKDRSEMTDRTDGI